MAQDIALRIYGGDLNTGFDASPLVSVGTIPAGYVPMPPVIVDEERSWMISHTQSHTVYNLYSRHCLTTKGEAGQMLISLFLSAQKRLADNASLLSLLNTIFDIFSIQVLQGGMLPAETADPSSFIALLKRYPLEERPLPLPVMGGRESVAFCVGNQTQLEALMRHSRYSILASVGRLELGMHCPSTIKLSTTGNTTHNTESKVVPEKESTSLRHDVKVLPDNSHQISGKRWNIGKKVIAAALALGVLLLLGIIYFNYNGQHEEQPTIAEVLLDEDKTGIQLIHEESPERLEPAEINMDKARLEILSLVNQKDLAACRNHPGWPLLQADERAGIEAVLDVNRYKGRLKKIVEQKVRRGMPFKSMKEIRFVQKEIWRYHMEEEL